MATPYIDTHISIEYSIQYGDRKMKLKEHQLTAKLIGKVFGLYPESVILFTDELEVPDDEGSFHLRAYCTYIVQGDKKPVVSANVEQCSGQSSSSTAGMAPKNSLPYQKVSGSPSATKKSSKWFA